jgi:hypothetical protein
MVSSLKNLVLKSVVINVEEFGCFVQASHSSLRIHTSLLSNSDFSVENKHPFDCCFIIIIIIVIIFFFFPRDDTTHRLMATAAGLGGSSSRSGSNLAKVYTTNSLAVDLAQMVNKKKPLQINFYNWDLVIQSNYFY